MSRTFRRKGYEDTQNGSWDREGRRIGGFYTVTNVERLSYKQYWKRIYTYREPTKAEFYKRYWAIHGESRSNKAYSPAWCHRNNRMRQNRMINKRELCKWFKYEDYEPLFEADPRNCWWDWN